MPPYSAPALGTKPHPSPMPYLSRSFIAPQTAAESGPTSLAEALHLLEEARQTVNEQKARIHQLENMTQTDELTGLMNRRGFMAAMRRELVTSRRNKKNNSLLVLLDLDGFKQVNDLYGHAIGDAYLQSVASILLNEVRSSDYVARLGGDEFAILLTQISPKESAARLTKLEKAFNSRVMHSHDLSLPMRGSFGFAVVSEQETSESLLIAADMKLYASKAQRRKGMRAA